MLKSGAPQQCTHPTPPQIEQKNSVYVHYVCLFVPGCATTAYPMLTNLGRVWQTTGIRHSTHHL